MKELERELGMQTSIVGLYDVEDCTPFAPFVTPDHCVFSAYDAWSKGGSICMERESCPCPGAGYWFGGVEVVPRSNFSKMLLQNGGFQATEARMADWLDTAPHYERKHRYLVLGPLRAGQERNLQSVTLFVTPDQLGGLLACIEACKDTPQQQIVHAAFGAGCWELIAPCLLAQEGEPCAVIGATDVAMRQHLPSDVLAVSMNRLLWERLNAIPTERSPLQKSFWRRLQTERTKQER